MSWFKKKNKIESEIGNYHEFCDCIITKDYLEHAYKRGFLEKVLDNDFTAYGTKTTIKILKVL
jgi:hypothetical protein